MGRCVERYTARQVKYDIHISNARIWKGESERLFSGTMAIRDGIISATHEKSAESALHIDAGGRVIIPGFIDAHLHLTLGANMLLQLDLSDVRSRDSFEAAIAGHHAQMTGDAWLIAYGWSEENWPGHALPDRTWLAGAEDRPCVCYRHDQHAAVVNERVLQFIMGADEPKDGRIVRDDTTGEPTGLLVEAALWELVNPLVPEPDVALQRDSLLTAQSMLHTAGVTTVGSMEYSTAVRDVIEPMRDQLTLGCRMTLLDRTMPLDVSYADAFNNDQRVAIIGFKSFLDGTLGSRTARMLEAYADDSENVGLWLEHAADGTLQEWAQSVVNAGYSPSMHAIGDAAVRTALDIAIEFSKEHVRIEHAQHIHPDDVVRCAGRILSMQPLHMYDDAAAAKPRLGPARENRFFPFRSLSHAGGLLAFGSDWPIVSFDPIQGMRCAITGLDRQGECAIRDQTISVTQALKAYTSGAAHALRLPNVARIAPGMPADCVLLDRNPFDADWVSEPPRVALTIANGGIVYDGMMQGMT